METSEFIVQCQFVLRESIDYALNFEDVCFDLSARDIAFEPGMYGLRIIEDEKSKDNLP